MDLQKIRSGIDDIDKEILSLFMKRMELCKCVANYKKKHDIPVFQSEREQQIIERIKSFTGNDHSLETGAVSVFNTILDISKIIQNRHVQFNTKDIVYDIPKFDKAHRIGCQGTSGSNSEIATRLIFGDKKPIFYKTFEDVFASVQLDELDYGVIPVHNSTVGSISSTYDLMAKYNVYTVKEVCVEIHHCLAAKKPLKSEEISVVYSHPQAIAQCCDYLKANSMKTVEYGNTATAAAMVAESENDTIAAICSVECAKQLGLHIVVKDVSDCTINRTRFICIAHDIQIEPQSDAISVMLKIPDTKGSLYRLLMKFYVNGMNLLKIESRPLKDGSFNVMFYLDFSGRINDPNVKALMYDLSENVEYFRFLGTFKNE